MNISDIGIIISKKQFQESSYIITLFTKNHGLYKGIINRESKKNLSTYMEGNLVHFNWQARLDNHIGRIKGELIKSYSALIINDKYKLYAFNSIISLIKITFHEREPHNNFFPIFLEYLDQINNQFNFHDYIQLELGILSETGYSLTLDRCIVNGTTNDLSYVSPKSGKAVSFEAGKDYSEKLLKLPKIINDRTATFTNLDLRDCFILTNYFFSRYFSYDKNLLKARQNFIELLCHESV